MTRFVRRFNAQPTPWASLTDTSRVPGASVYQSSWAEGREYLDTKTWHGLAVALMTMMLPVIWR